MGPKGSLGCLVAIKTLKGIVSCNYANSENTIHLLTQVILMRLS